jgi:hypothetical protein
MIDKNATEAVDRRRALVMVKVFHTAIWGFFAGCIVALPVAAWWNRFDLAAILTGCVVVECAVLGLNRGRCPLTAIAARYTSDRSAAFDIYLPEWVAKRNKILFRTLFVLNEMIVIALWLAATRNLTRR